MNVRVWTALAVVVAAAAAAWLWVYGGLADRAEAEVVGILIQQDLPSTPPDGGMGDAFAEEVTALPDDFPLTLAAPTWTPEMVLATGSATMVAMSVDLDREAAVAALTSELAGVGCGAPVRTDGERQTSLQCLGIPAWATLSANVTGQDDALKAHISYGAATP